MIGPLVDVRCVPSFDSVENRVRAAPSAEGERSDAAASDRGGGT